MFPMYSQFIAEYRRSIGAELGVDHETILKDSRGRRSIDTLRLYDPSKANWECRYFEPGLSHRGTNEEQMSIVSKL